MENAVTHQHLAVKYCISAILGNGTKVSAQDTVPFTLWCAAQHLDNYEEALWLTVSGLGDRDTNCAIVGGIVSLSTGVESIPDA
ncbi:ADP-ribosylglycohydrolase family protein [Rivularia sp. UHCC 0363]|uniref:ADP-ribosylglycohydrolase family protein n=1 Tax=Rivularia sp. UHCC 0363 TaxID=3110244 RepID=UPI002B21CC1F|nr:ADP-ribosylglycohydrolase family protein [Rivularia sp. UHCC 0363]MEA5594520.1 ADP-ribosylglycohydrolase family protein [Rivularia sp. UHCC 0363]